MRAQHTPGPWKFGFESVDPEWAIVTHGQGLVVANVNSDMRQEANARLISAAPELLEALVTLVQEVTVLEMFGETGSTASKTNVDDAVRKARFAIAKAKGTP